MVLPVQMGQFQLRAKPSKAKVRASCGSSKEEDESPLCIPPTRSKRTHPLLLVSCTLQPTFPPFLFVFFFFLFPCCHHHHSLSTTSTTSHRQTDINCP